ncbi:hypothetical protein ScPMuIL_015343 [Solemya velum]
MAVRKMVYIYNGLGISDISLAMLTSALKRHLDPSFYNVCHISPEDIIEGSWRNKTSLLAVGGGYDLGFIKALTSSGIAQIRDFVVQGGQYLGICAGAYFACEEIEFDRAGPLEVCGQRQLKFFPGVGIGPVYPGFVYNTEKGAVAAPLIYKTLDSILDFKTYFNGGCCFLPNEFSGMRNFRRKESFEVLTNSTHTLHMNSRNISTRCCSQTKDESRQSSACEKKGTDICESSGNQKEERLSEKREKVDEIACSLKAHDGVEVLGYYSGIVGNLPAIVRCDVGRGRAVLSGVHVEYCSHDLDQNDPDLARVLPELQAAQMENKTCFVSLLNHLDLKTV